VSYFAEDKLAAIKTLALEEAKRTDDLWSFVHTFLMQICEQQGGFLGCYLDKWAKGCDGIYKMKDGTFDVNMAAEVIQVALEVRAAFYQERAENEKSG